MSATTSRSRPSSRASRRNPSGARRSAGPMAWGSRSGLEGGGVRPCEDSGHAATSGRGTPSDLSRPSSDDRSQANGPLEGGGPAGDVPVARRAEGEGKEDVTLPDIARG